MSTKQKIYPWLIMISCCGFAAATMGIISNCAGVFLLPIAQDLQIGVGKVSFYLTVLSLVNGFFSPVIVRLIHKFPLKLLCSIGSVLVVCGVYSMSTFTSYIQFYFAAALIGIGYTSIAVIPINLLLGNWFKKNVGVITGLTLSFSGLFGALFNPIFSSVISASGWRVGYQFMALVVAILALPGAFFIVHLRPADLHLKAYGETEEAKPASKEPLEKGAPTIQRTSLTQTLPLYIFALCVSGVVGFGSHIPGYGSVLGLGASVGALMTTYSMLGNVSSKLVLGILCDRLGVQKSLLLYASIVTLGVLGLFFLPANPGLLQVIAPFSFGLIYACASVGLPLFVKSQVGGSQFGSVYSTCTLFSTLANATLVSVNGSLFDLTGSYAIPLLIAAAAGLLMILLVIGVMIHTKKQKKIEA